MSERVLCMLIPQDYHPSWEVFLSPEVRGELDRIETAIGEDFTPERDKVLRFLRLDLGSRKVVILGQDPYKPQGVANGRSFQPDNLESWTQSFRQISLKNMIRLLYKTSNGIEEYGQIPSYKEIAAKIAAGEFSIKPPKEWFDSLETQGVLFLNTYLTCKINLSNSHKAIWEPFSKKLLSFISEQRPDLCWFLWGSEALSNKPYLKAGRLFESRHPMMCAEYYEDDFLKCPCFRDTGELINWLG